MIIIAREGAFLFLIVEVLYALLNPQMLHLIIMGDVERFEGFLKGDVCCCVLEVEGSLEVKGFYWR
jgi:hypothetical protein